MDLVFSTLLATHTCLGGRQDKSDCGPYFFLIATSMCHTPLTYMCVLSIKEEEKRKSPAGNTNFSIMLPSLPALPKNLPTSILSSAISLSPEDDGTSINKYSKLFDIDAQIDLQMFFICIFVCSQNNKPLAWLIFWPFFFLPSLVFHQISIDYWFVRTREIEKVRLIQTQKHYYNKDKNEPKRQIFCLFLPYTKIFDFR